MLRLYRHRVNSLRDLAETAPGLGVEFDLRSDGQRVIITHDPFTDGPTIEEFFPALAGRSCIFNVKCEGIESRVIELAKRHGIDEYFFLDLSVPAAVKLWRQGERRFAVRYSEHEPMEGALAWAGKASWLWVDCFEAYPTSKPAWERLHEQFKICLVSPELQGHGTDAIATFRASLGSLPYEAACTKRPDLWSGP